MGSSISTCFSYYKETHLEIIKLPITQRFDDFANKNKGSSPVFMLDQFLSKELEGILTKYNNQTELLKSTGVDSKLKSRLKVFDANLSTAEILINQLLELYEARLGTLASSKGKGFFGFFRRNNQIDENKISLALADFKSCKSIVDKCTLELQFAIQETSTNLVVIDKLIQELASFSAELKVLDQYVSSQNDYVFFQMLMNQKIESIEMMIKLMLTNSNIEKSNMTMALIKVRAEVSVFREKIELLIAKGAPDELAWKDESTNNVGNAINDKPRPDEPNNYQKELAKIKDLEHKYRFIKSLAEINYKLRKFVFTAEESSRVLANSFGKEGMLFRNLRVEASTDVKSFVVYTNVMPFLALDILRITEPSKDSKVNSQFLSQIYLLTSLDGDLYSHIQQGLKMAYPVDSTDWINWREEITQHYFNEYKTNIELAVKPFLIDDPKIANIYSGR